MRQELVFTGPGHVVWQGQDLPDAPADHEILVENLVTLCDAGSVDMAAFRGYLPTGSSWPYRPGCGAAGVVASVGKDVSGFAPGDRVCTAAAHETHSVIDVRTAPVCALPPGTTTEAGAFAFLLSRCLHVVGTAVRSGDERVCVVGSGARAVMLAAAADLRGVEVSQVWVAPGPGDAASERRSALDRFDVVLVAPATDPAVATALRSVAAGGRIFLIDGSPVPVTDLSLGAGLRGATVVDVTGTFSVRHLSPAALSQANYVMAEAAALLSEGAGQVVAPVSQRSMPGSAPLLYPTIQGDPLAFSGVIILLQGS